MRKKKAKRVAKSDANGQAKGADKSQQMLNAYDRITDAKIEWVFHEAKKLKCGRKSPLVSVTKIIDITKKGSSSSACLAFLFETLLLRIVRATIEEDISTSQLVKLLPTLKGIHEMIVACKTFFIYDSGSLEEGLIQGLLQKPWGWHNEFKDTTKRSEQVISLSGTGLKIVKFMESLHNGAMDNILKDVIFSSGFHALTIEQKNGHGNLHWILLLTSTSSSELWAKQHNRLS